MRTPFLPFSRPTISEDEIAAVADVLRSGWITTGKKSVEFEEKFAARCRAEAAVALSSATGGMHLLLKALGIGPGDEVITPSMTWVSTINLIKLAGATPVFADVDRDSLMVTAETVESKISACTRLIIPVHFAGAALDLDALNLLAQKYGIALVEDAAHAIGTEYRGEPVGTCGTSVFSFHPIKNITTGEGGMICSDNVELIAHIRRLKFHGLGVDAWDRSQQGRSPQAEVLEPGYKYNLTDICATLGLGQLARLDEFNAARTCLAERYHELLAGIDELSPLRRPEEFGYAMRHAWHLFIVRLDTDRAGMSRDDFMARLKEKNIGTGLHFRAAHTQRYYRESMPGVAGTLPNTEWNSDRILSLPLFPDMTEDDQDDVLTAIKEVLK
ncbi:UDP-4-amino-4-deoxy-L-arabinose aminotransferase [Desulforhopalus vacuolatus]|uniref:aminotransferase class I/II-fold pyridoxal phosphate-dependent enzyme n=1 Tax=Desulforhopalus vacuolatus TaxID=40414 RepID=UPI0019636A17|nr:aminotransferase class I/II-fold pyridoxal phosphate-dependent enzyme [Desulforhopalus vacuolatus]MBM9519133.1 UDP-4-amino-4-deoxy-L-arabinose aminotransferase [Desulforhopalus vacuolatus]